MKRLLTRAALLLSALAGCGQSIPPEAATPHGGTLVTLPGGRGFAEILKRTDPAGEGQTQVVVYFLDEARKPISPAPASATLKFRDANIKPVDLAPADGSSLVSAGFADPGEVSGMLSTTIGGGPVSVPIQVR